MAHRDTNDNEGYDFLETDGAADGPYVAAGMQVMDAVGVEAVDDGIDYDVGDDEAGDDGSATDESADDGGADDGVSQDDALPGFGIVVALGALLAAALLAIRRP